MKLEYSIPGKLWWISNFLDMKTYKIIHNKIFKDRKKINLHSVKDIWGKELYEGIQTKPKKTGDIQSHPFEKLKTLVKRNPFFTMPDVENLKMTSGFHYLEKDSGINWHDDGHGKYGATYYLNKRWNKNWGGEFMFTHQKGHGWIPPIGNSLILVKAPVLHKVNTVLSPVIPRITVQMFMKNHN